MVLEVSSFEWIRMEGFIHIYVIIRPMDLLKMEEKLDNGEYRSFTEFRTDFKLIVNNCRLYNGQNNGDYYK